MEPKTAWFSAAAAYLEYYCAESPVSDEEFQTRDMAAVDGFHGLFHELVKELKIRDEWPKQKQLCYNGRNGAGTIEVSGKIGVQFTMAITTGGWLIEAPLRYSQHIRYMTDEFWGLITKLACIGKASLPFSFLPKASPESKRLLQHKASIVFSLVRDYVLLEQMQNEDSMINAGLQSDIEVLLPIESKERAVRQFYLEGLDSLYHANYLLYRAAYLEGRRKRGQTIKGVKL